MGEFWVYVGSLTFSRPTQIKLNENSRNMKFAYNVANIMQGQNW